jgi:hypothetical protein
MDICELLSRLWSGRARWAESERLFGSPLTLSEHPFDVNGVAASEGSMAPVPTWLALGQIS